MQMYSTYRTQSLIGPAASSCHHVTVSYGSSLVILTLTLIAIGRTAMAAATTYKQTTLTPDQLLAIMQDNDETCEL